MSLVLLRRRPVLRQWPILMNHHRILVEATMAVDRLREEQAVPRKTMRERSKMKPAVRCRSLVPCEEPDLDHLLLATCVRGRD